jgi:hypothetical protein
VFAAINPVYAITFVSTHGHIGLIALGAGFWPSPAARRSMPISAISAASPFSAPGSGLRRRRC